MPLAEEAGPVGDAHGLGQVHLKRVELLAPVDAELEALAVAHLVRCARVCVRTRERQNTPREVRGNKGGTGCGLSEVADERAPRQTGAQSSRAQVGNTGQHLEVARDELAPQRNLCPRALFDENLNEETKHGGKGGGGGVAEGCMRAP